MAPSLLWFRRDLRLADHPALQAAAADGPVVGVFVCDPLLLAAAGPPRRAFLFRCLRDLDERIGGRLVVVTGDPVAVLPRLVADAGARAVHVSADFGPYGTRRDAAVAAALGEVPLVATGSPYAVSPGRVRKPDGSPYRVFTPFSRAWSEAGWRRPAPSAALDVAWTTAGLRSEGVPPDPDLGATALPAAGEAAAHERWEAFRTRGLHDYADRRDLPAEAGTSRLSVDLKYGTVHPRTLLADLGDSAGARTFRSELCWREFYADVLAREPQARHQSLDPRMASMEVDTGQATRARFEAWAGGHTGFPIVDAGMRQLAAEAWVHNRVRMIVASFLVKDLHLDWSRGARYFLRGLVDGDLASNHLGWQWVAGTGTDAAPYFRVFNPITQGLKFDPDGSYVRRYVPELAGLPGALAHRPWDAPGGVPEGYPQRIVDHAHQRLEALARYQRVRA